MRKHAVQWVLVALTALAVPGGRAVAQLWSSCASGTARNLHGIAFAGRDLGAAVGDYGTLIRTTDGGDQWHEMSTATTQHLRAVALLPDGSGFVVGANGIIFHSTDAFATWSAQPSGTTAFLAAIACRSASNALVAGVNGTVLRTTNGGGSWTALPTGITAPLRAVAFANDDVAVAVGAFGTLIRTSDRGDSWSATILPFRPTLNAVIFFDALHGFISADGGVAYETSDGGLTWHFTPVESRLLAFAQFSPQWCAAVGYALALTSDEGATWDTRYVPATLESVVFRDSLRLFAVGAGGLVAACLLDQQTAPPMALRDPADGARDVPMLAIGAASFAVEFQWEPYRPLLATAYTIQVARDSAFAGALLVNGSAGSGVANDSSTAIVDIPPGEDFYWRMRAEFGHSSGPWSPVRRFAASLERWRASAREIQEVPAESLAVADSLEGSGESRWRLQASPLLDSLRVVVGVVVAPTEALRTTMESLQFEWRDWFMIADTGAGGGTWSGLRVNNSWLGPLENDTIIWRLRRGDVVLMTGKPVETPPGSTDSETGFECLSIRVIDSGAARPPAPRISLGDLYRGMVPYGAVRYAAGEQYEGMRVEFTGLSVYSVENPTTGILTLKDPSGNSITVNDESRWFTLRSHRSPWSTYAPPPPGTRIDTLRGIIRTTGGRYQVMPVDSSDLVLGASVFGTITGTAFNDLNRNGVRDPGEPPFPNLLLNVGGAVRLITATDSLGRYRVAGLDSGSYTVTREQRSGWTQAAPDSGSWSIHLSPDEAASGKDFAMYYLWNSISGTVYHDLEENGVRDSTDPGMEGVMLRLSGETTDSVRTDAEGRFEFSHVGAGLHYVDVAPPPSWEESLPVYMRGYQTTFHAYDVHASGAAFALRPVPERVRFRLVVRNAVGSRELWIGVRPGATYGIWGADPAASVIDFSESEAEIPPQTPGIFDARLVDPAGGLARFGEGSWTDLRPYVSAAQTDTFRVTFLPGAFFGGTFPMTLAWSHAWAETLYSGRVSVIDPEGRVSDMKAQDSLVLADSSRNWVTIIAEGPELTLSTRESSPELPTAVMLTPNFPNPFNPATTMEIVLPQPGDVTLAVYDVLGRVVATLVTGRREAGTTRVRWDAAGMPSGVYFARLTTPAATLCRKMLLLR
jgi:photosystem II stability/assembly factor-like uncharacterized protein